jgi:hypothetical protein
MLGIKIKFWCMLCLTCQLVYLQAGTPDSSFQKQIRLGGIPILAFDNDLGLRYGAVINVLDYGKPPFSSDYQQYLNIKIFNSTKGTSNLSVVFESEKILKKSIVFAEISVITDSKLDFFGFNGKKAIYNESFLNPEHSEYLNQFFYSHYRRIYRFRFDMHKKLAAHNWRVFSGLSFQNNIITDLNYKKLKPIAQLNGSDALEVSLYQYYSNWGVIGNDEQNGGKSFSLIGGISYDTRNQRINCTDGVWFENFLVGNIGLSKQYSFIKLINTLRLYQHFGKTNTILTLRASSQQKVFGQIPFYLLPVYYDTHQNQDGVGGAFNMRGVFRNRIASNGFVNVNGELRKNLFSLRFFKMHWQASISAFFDLAFITQKYKTNTNGVPDEQYGDFFTNSNQKLFATMGIGAYFIYNETNIISVNMGYSPDQQLGKTGIYIGSAFIF